MYKRLLQLPADPETSFFLWGSRQTGKTTLLKAAYPKAVRIDLRKTDNGVYILPYDDFIDSLWAGEWTDGQQTL